MQPKSIFNSIRIELLKAYIIFAYASIDYVYAQYSISDTNTNKGNRGFIKFTKCMASLKAQICTKFNRASV